MASAEADPIYAPLWTEVATLAREFLATPTGAARKAALRDRLLAIRDGKAEEAHARLAIVGLKALVAMDAAREGHPVKAAGLKRECWKLLRASDASLPGFEAIRALARAIP